MPGVLDPQPAEWIENLTQIEVTDPVLGGDDGIANIQAKEFDARTRNLKEAIEDIAEQLTDISFFTIQKTDQSVTVANGDVNKSIDVGLGAIIHVTLNNNATCTLAFTGLLKNLSGLLFFTASGADRTITLPTTWHPEEDTRTLTIKSGQTRALPFHVATLAGAPSENVYAGVLGYRHL